MDAGSVNSVKFRSAKSGRRVAPWQGNCVAIGEAAGFVEPLESTALHFTQSMIVRFLNLFPTRVPDVEPHEYNRLVRNELERARDLAIAHYATAGLLVGSAFLLIQSTIVVRRTVDRADGVLAVI